MDKGIGQYDKEYAACPCFWGTTPGKFVYKLTNHIKTGTALDLGAGEGKNSIYLAELGFFVEAVEISELAIKNFKDRLNRVDKKIQDRINITHTNVLEYKPKGQFDVVIAYGLLHCLPTINDVSVLVERIKNLTKTGGYIVIVTFNDEIPIPDVQSYLEPTLVSRWFLKESFQDYQIVEIENATITETHPTSSIEHIHSLTRILCKKIN